MSNPRFRPRDFAVEPRRFGAERTIEWVAPRSAAEQVLLRAAQIHHDIAYQARRALVRDGLTQRDLARSCGLTEDRISRLLNGRLVLQITDIAAIDVVIEGVWDVELFADEGPT